MTKVLFYTRPEISLLGGIVKAISVGQDPDPPAKNPTSKWMLIPWTSAYLMIKGIHWYYLRQFKESPYHINFIDTCSNQTLLWQTLQNQNLH